MSVVASAACFGTLGVLANLAYARGAEPLPMLAWRFALVTTLMVVYQALRDRRALRVGFSDVGRFAALSLTGYGAASLCFFFALKFAPASVVAVLLYAYPALVTLAGWALDGRRPDGWRMAALVGTFIGCILVLDPFGAGAVRPLGVVLGFGAALGYAAFNVLSHRWMSRSPRSVLMAYTFGISAVVVSLLGVATGSPPLPVDWPVEVWALVGAIVLVPTFAAVVLYLEGIRGLGPSQAAIVSTLEPLFTIALAAALLGERLTAVQWMGAALVVAGVVTAETGERRPQEPAMA